MVKGCTLKSNRQDRLMHKASYPMTTLSSCLKKSIIGGLAASLLAFNAWANTLNLAYDADPVSLDPHEQISGATLQYSHMVFDPLVRWNKDHKIDARLAEKWERIDDRTVRFHLRKGVKFHTGNNLTSKDVVWTFKRLKNSPDFKAIFEPFSEMKVIDDYTFDLVSKDSYPLTLNAATYIFPMDSQFYSGKDETGELKSAVKKHSNSFASRAASGTGPFKVMSREQGIKVVFERFKDYWDKQSPGNVDTIIQTSIKEDSTRVLALLSGDVDFIAPVPPNDLDRIRKDKNVQLVEMNGTRIITFQLGQDRVEAFKDKRVRQAIVYAVNNEAIAKKIMKGFATVAAQNSPEGYLGHNPDLKPRYDLAKAKQLMKEAGYEKGFTVSMLTPNNRYVNDEKIAQAVASMLSKINIKVNLKTVPKAQYWPEFDKKAADILMLGWHSDTEDSANFAEFLTACPDPGKGLGQYNSGGYCNKDLDKLLVKANQETDVNKRKQMLQQIEKIQYDDVAFVPLHFQNLAWAARKGVNIEPIVNVMNFPYLGDLVIDK
jgi:peptide/nickel transport system substrate-binding protein